MSTQSAGLKGIIFDFDGTLANSLGLAMQSLNYALDQVGLPPRQPEVIKKYFGSSADKILSQVLKNHGRAEEAFQIYLDHQRTVASRAELFPEIKEVLHELKNLKLPMGIVTGRHQLDLEINIERHAIKQLFSSIVTDDMVSAPKPAPEGILKVIQDLKLMPNQVVYIGDSTVDMLAAKAAGAKAAAALWDGLADQQEMKLAGADMSANTPQEFLMFVKRNLDVSY